MPGVGDRPGRATILYDAECGFCRWSLRTILAWDRAGRLRPVALQSPDANRFVGDLDPGRRMASWHLVTGDGRRYSGGAAVAPLARLLPLGAPVAALAETFPSATDRAYTWVSRNRGRLARLLSATRR